MSEGGQGVKKKKIEQYPDASQKSSKCLHLRQPAVTLRKTNNESVKSFFTAAGPTQDGQRTGRILTSVVVNWSRRKSRSSSRVSRFRDAVDRFFSRRAWASSMSYSNMTLAFGSRCCDGRGVGGVKHTRVTANTLHLHHPVLLSDISEF